VSGSNIDIHPSASVGKKTRLSGNITLKKDVSIAWDCNLDGDVYIGEGTNMNGKNNMIGDISVGKYCAIAPRAKVRTDDHPTFHPGMQVQLYNKIGCNMATGEAGSPVEIGHDVWICADAKILSGVTVGNGAIIGANAVVVDDVEPFSLVAGNPAEHKKYRFDASTRETLNELKWWNWTDDKMRNNSRFFEADLRQVDDVKHLLDTDG
jgi:virginiamycin A acetyltransferase